MSTFKCLHPGLARLGDLLDVQSLLFFVLDQALNLFVLLIELIAEALTPLLELAIFHEQLTAFLAQVLILQSQLC